jgi:hypothetical protein
MTENQAKKPVTITRDDLYTQVWATPMQRLAARYGISGNGLAKICDRLNVPYPPRGYWAKKEAGKPVQQTALPPANPNTSLQVRISPTPPRSLPATMSPELQKDYETALEQASGIRVPESLRRPHPIIAGWIAERARQAAEAKRYQWALPERTTKLDGRRHRVLDTLFKEVEKRGYKVVSRPREGTWLETGRDHIEFDLSERIRQVRRRVTEEEKRGPFHQHQEWRQERVPTATLVFKIKTYLDRGIPKEWSDEEGRPLEERVGEIVAVLVAVAPLLKVKRAAAEAAERKRLEEEHRRREEADRQRRERHRWRRFMELAKQWEEADAARTFLARLETLSPPNQDQPGERTHSEWLTWARSHIDTHDPISYGIKAIWNTLAQVTSWEYHD